MSFVEYQPHQVVFLECHDKRLYAEVIQTVTDRSLCWARPLVMLTLSWGSAEQPSLKDDRHFATEITLEMLTDLRQESDLLLPLSWFQVAVDIDVIPVLAQLSGLKSESHLASVETRVLHRPSAQEQLQQFIHVLCQTQQSLSDSPD